MSVLVIVEHDEKNVNPATLSVLAAAHKLSASVDVLVIGNNIETVVNEIAEYSLSKVKVVKTTDSYAIAENYSKILQGICEDYKYVLMSANTFGKNILPRAAALMGFNMVSDIVEVINEDTFVRPIYAGNAMETIQSLESKHFITVRPTAFNAVEKSDNKSEIVNLDLNIELSTTKFIELKTVKSERPELTQAKVIVSGGRGLQSGDNFKMLESLADKLNAAIGASRAAVDAGFVANDHQVGQTGKIVAPDLYIAIGISGAIQHLAGMKDSKVIVAINKDADAPIFQIADYGLVGDLFEIVPELINEL